MVFMWIPSIKQGLETMVVSAAAAGQWGRGAALAAGVVGSLLQRCCLEHDLGQLQ